MPQAAFRHPLHFALVILSSLHLQTCLNIGINDTNELQPSFYETPTASDLVDKIKIPHTIVPEEKITHGYDTIDSILISERTSLLSSKENSFEFGFGNYKSTEPLELPVSSTTSSVHHSQLMVKEITDEHGAKSLTEEVSQSHDLSSVLTLDAKLINTNSEINGPVALNSTEAAALVNVSSGDRIMQTQIMLAFNESGISLPQSEAESIMSNVEGIDFIYNSSMLLSNTVILPPMKVTKNDTSLLLEDYVPHYSTKVIYTSPSSVAQSQFLSYPLLTEDKLLFNTDIKSTLFPDDFENKSSSKNIYQVSDETALNDTTSKSDAKSVSVEIKEPGALDMESSFAELNQSVHKVHEKAHISKSSVNSSFQSVIDSKILGTFTSEPQNGTYIEYGENNKSEKMTNFLAAIQLLQNSPQNNRSLPDMKDIMLILNRGYHSSASKILNDTMVKEQMLADIDYYKNELNNSHFEPNDIPCSIYIPIEKTHQFIVKFMVLQNSSKQADLPKIFAQHLRNVLNDTRCLSVVRLSFSDSTPFIFTWTNSTVNSSVCALSEIHQMTKMMYNSSGVLSEFSEAFLPDFEIVNVRLELLGSCIQMKIGPNIGVIAFSVACAFSSLPCIIVVICKLLHSSRRLSKLHKDKLKKPRSPAIFKLEQLPVERSPYVYVSRRSRNDEIFLKNFQRAHEVFQISEDSPSNSHICNTPKHTALFAHDLSECK